MTTSTKRSNPTSESAAGLFPTDEVILDVPALQYDRPPLITHLSDPAYQSPLRHHRRGRSAPKRVKETLDAHSEYTNSQDDGVGQHRINQYVIKQEIGRGSFGAVHLACDQYGTEYAVKEFSKSRLRKRAQSNILRRPHAARGGAGHLRAHLELNSPLHRRSVSDIHDAEEDGNPLHLIREEVAIMKKLNHNNLVSLIEVLDDPQEDSLYMVLEMCKKGVIMKVGVDEKAEPYPAESCRCWFRDLILGIEYLHAQGVVHRDIKPDNLLLDQDDVLKIVDFGVSEMFQKDKESDMRTAKSAGSPAFLPPELCVARHGEVSGKAADIWSMGVTLYCLRFGRIPFEKTGVLELYESIKADDLAFHYETEPEFVDLMHKLLEKDPEKRIKMPELRSHPWVTKNGTDPLLSTAENTSDLVEPPTEYEMSTAITSSIRHLLTVMRAVKKFKHSVSKRRPDVMESILGGEIRVVEPPISYIPPKTRPGKSRSYDASDRRPVQGALTVEGLHRDVAREMDLSDMEDALPAPGSSASSTAPNDAPGSRELAREDEKVRVVADDVHMLDSPPSTSRQGSSRQDSSIPPTTTSSISHPPSPESARKDSGSVSARGQAHDPLADTPLVLGIGAGSFSGDSSAGFPSHNHQHTLDKDKQEPNPEDNEGLYHVISESPPATDINVYETAYHEEVERIRRNSSKDATIYLTRRVDAAAKELASEQHGKEGGEAGGAPSAWGKVRGKFGGAATQLPQGKKGEEASGESPA